MSITAIFKPKASADLPPAAAALAALKQRIPALTAENDRLAIKEGAATADVRAHDAALEVLHQLEDRRLAALADREVSGSSAEDPESLQQDVNLQRVHAERLGERRRLAEKVFDRVRAQRGQLREEQIRVASMYLECQHAAAREHMVGLAEEFKQAEATYLRILAQVYGAARVVNRFARERPQLAFVGDLNPGGIHTPRPQDPAFDPVPQRPDIARAIETEAEALFKAL